MQDFSGKINFLQKFISDYVHIVKHIQDMIKQDAPYSWGKKEKDVPTLYNLGTQADAPMLYNLYFSKDFFLYTFASDNSLTAVLT